LKLSTKAIFSKTRSIEASSNRERRAMFKNEADGEPSTRESKKSKLRGLS
jgi:hypothetical protein